MVALPTAFNTAEVPDSEFELIQPGEYTAMITESEMKATKDQMGAYLQLKIVLQDSGRVLFERLNIQNKNDQAVTIAYQTMKKICEAIGKTNIRDSEELHNKRFVVVVEVEKGKPYTKDGETKEGRDQNRIKTYKAYGAAQSNTGGAAAQPASGGNAALPPWKR